MLYNIVINMNGGGIMKKDIMIGLVLIAVGVLLIVQKTVGLDINIWNFIWPLFLLVPGISMHINYFSNPGNSGSLVLAGVLTVYGALFMINVLTNWVYTDNLTFVYPLGIAIGFLDSYAFGDKRSSRLSSAIIFLAIAAYIFMDNILPGVNFKDYILPGLLIILGIYVLIKNRK